MFRPRIFRRGVSKNKGQRSEELAACFLKKKGYKIVDRNFRKRYGEVDIIAEKNNTLVFVEVRSLTGDFMDPLESITPQKIERISKTAAAYLMEMDWNGDVRFYFIGIKGEVKDRVIEHFENFFGF